MDVLLKKIKLNMGVPRYLLVAVLFILVSACDRDNNNPGYVYFPDMDVSEAYETYTENPVFENGMTNQLPVEGTVPRGHIPYPYPKTEEAMKIAGEELVNPFEPTDDVLAQGKANFERYCTQCHGEKGDGKGLLFTSGRYPFPPANLLLEKVRVKPEGEIFHNITVGFGVMGAHGPLVRPDERWKIVSYITNVLHDQPIPVDSTAVAGNQ